MSLEISQIENGSGNKQQKNKISISCYFFSVKAVNYYFTFLAVSKEILDSNKSCLDATFNTKDSREEIKKKLNLSPQQICIIECICPEDIVITRIKNRKSDYSDADAYIYRNMKANYQPIQQEHIVVDTSKESPNVNAAKIINQLSKISMKKNCRN